MYVKMITVMIMETVASLIGEKVPTLFYKTTLLKYMYILVCILQNSCLVLMYWIIVKRTHLINKKKLKIINYDI